MFKPCWCSAQQPRMDQYFNQMDKIIKERKTSSRIRFMLQDVLDLRKVTDPSVFSMRPA